MSTFGIATYRPDGSTMMSGLTRGGVFIEILTIPGGGNGSKSYPGTGGSSLYFYTASAARHTVSVGTDANGAGCINWTATDTNSNVSTVIYVFASKLVTSNTYGIVVTNNQGETLADQGYPNPQYLTKVALNATATANYTTPDGYTAYVHTSTAATYQDSSDKFVLVAMPDSGTNDTWYSLFNECIRAGSGAMSLQVTVYTKTTSYTLPSLHVYAINHVAPSSSTYGIQLHDQSGALTYDSSMESVSTTDVLTVSYPAYGSTNTYALAVTSLPGISIPYFYQADYSGSTSTRYVSAAKKVGSQITFCLIKDVQASNAPVLASYKLGSQSGRYCPVVDLSALGPDTPAGTPGGTTWTYPAFTVQPQPVHVPPNTNVTFTVDVTGNPTPTLQWYKGNVAVQGQTGKTYSFVAQLSDDHSSIQCLATNSRGSANSNPVILRCDNFTDVSINSYSVSPSSVTAGASVTVSMTASGSPTISLSIIGPNGAVASGTGTSLSKTFTAQTTDAGTYSFSASNSDSAGHASQSTAAATLSVANAPPITITQQPQGGSVTQGGTFTLTCLASQSGASYAWHRIVNSVASNFGGPGSSVNADTSSTGSSQYYCVVSNGVSSATSNTVTVTVNSAAPPSPVISQQPGDCYVTAPAAGSFTCVASPVTSYQWYKNGVAVSGATGSSIYIGTTSTANDGDQYQCIAYNGSAATSSSIGTLHVSPGTVTPSFSQQPGDCYVTAPNPGSFACAASPVTSYQWYRNGVAVSGATSSSIYIGRTLASNDGDAYYCVATNTANGATASRQSNTAYLYVNSTA